LFKKLLRTSVIYAVGPQLPKVVGFFLLPVLTPYLSKNDFGVWGSIMAYALLFSAARDMGMIAPMVNTFYQHPSRWKWVWRQINTFLLFFGVLYTVIQILVLYWVMPEEAADNRYIILMLIAFQSLFLDIPNQIGARYLQLAEKPLTLAAISMISGFIAIVIQLYCVIMIGQGYMGWFYSAFFSAFFSGIFYCVIIYKEKLHPIRALRLRWLKPRIKLSLPMLPHNYSAYLLGASDRMVMSQNNVSTQNIGLYNVAYMWGNYIDIFGNAVGMAVGPMYLKMYSEKLEANENKILQLTQFLQLLFLIGPFLIAIWSRELFLIFINNRDLQQSYDLSIIIIMGYSYRPLYWNVVNRLQFHNKTNQLWKISLVGGLINLVLNVILIPIYGYKIAAVTTFFALMYIGFFGYFLKVFKELDQNKNYPILWLIAISFFTGLAYILKDINWMYKLILCISLITWTIFYIKAKYFRDIKYK